MLRFEGLNAAHIQAILEIENASQGAPWSERAFANELSHPHSIFCVAFQNKELVGYGGIWTVVDEAHVTTITVAPSHRGKGYGMKLMTELLNRAKAAGMTCSTLEVRASNQAAIGLYERLGYHCAAVRRRYYPDNHEDAVIMWLYGLGEWQPPK
ncbi:MAG: ribosomal protein S18-alanine N-acetyltransferase [Chthonomonas sp.]|nr:ribosomal protein S18-alanine N-acetyltransferase [Chthonomonas sp.]